MAIGRIDFIEVKPLPDGEFHMGVAISSASPSDQWWLGLADAVAATLPFPEMTSWTGGVKIRSLTVEESVGRDITPAP